MTIYVERTPGACISRAVADGRTNAVKFSKGMGWWRLWVAA